MAWMIAYESDPEQCVPSHCCRFSLSFPVLSPLSIKYVVCRIALGSRILLPSSHLTRVFVNRATPVKFCACNASIHSQPSRGNYTYLFTHGNNDGEARKLTTVNRLCLSTEYPYPHLPSR